MVHRQLGYAPLQGQPVTLWHRVGEFLQTAYHGEVVVQQLPDACRVCLMDGRCLSLAVVVGLRLGQIHALCPYQQLGCELLVLAVVDAGREAQLSSDALTEQVTAGCPPDILTAHQFRAALHPRGIERVGTLTVVVGEVEHHHVGIFIVADDVKTVLIGCLDQEVVAVDNLDVFTLRHRQCRVSGHAHTTVLLSEVDDLVTVFQQAVHRTVVRAVVHDDDLPLCRTQRESEDAVDTRAQHIQRQVVTRQDKADQWLLFHIGCKGNKKYGNLSGFNFISKKVEPTSVLLQKKHL